MGWRWDRFPPRILWFFLAIIIPQTSPYSLFNLPRTLHDLSNTLLSALKKEAVFPSETLIYSVCFWSTAVSQPNGLLRSHKCFKSECSYTRPWRRKRYVDSKRRYSARVLHDVTKYEAQYEGKRCWFICWHVVLHCGCFLVNVIQFELWDDSRKSRDCRMSSCSSYLWLRRV